MNFHERRDKYILLKKELEWIDHSLACNEDIYKTDMAKYETRANGAAKNRIKDTTRYETFKAEWQKLREECQKKIEELG